jgi:hypothetical protein
VDTGTGVTLYGNNGGWYYDVTVDGTMYTGALNGNVLASFQNLTNTNHDLVIRVLSQLNSNNPFSFERADVAVGTGRTGLVIALSVYRKLETSFSPVLPCHGREWMMQIAGLLIRGQDGNKKSLLTFRPPILEYIKPGMLMRLLHSSFRVRPSPNYWERTCTYHLV